jgi:hypothetical protein
MRLRRWCSHPAIVSGVLVLAIAAVYAQVRQFYFVDWDDGDYVTTNPHVLAGLRWSGVVWAFTTWRAGNWHPLAWLSHMLDQTLYGDWAGGHHLTSVLLHAVNSVLLFLLFRRMTGAVGRSAVVAGLFALHPLHVESVAWVSERKDVLSTCFAFLALHAWVSWTRTGRGLSYGLALGAFVLGCLSKPMVVTLPGVMLLLDLWPLRRVPPVTRAVLREKAPFVAVAVVVSGITLVAQHDAIASTETLPLGMRPPNVVLSYVAYLRSTLWPKGLAYFYPYREQTGLWLPLAAGLLLLVITIGAVRTARTVPYVTVGWLWYLGTLVPVIGIVQAGVQAMADRFTYVPLIGIFVIVVWGAVDLATRWRVPPAVPRALAAVALVASGVLSHRQAATWRNDRALLQHALAVTDGNYVALNMLGAAFDRDGRWEEARRYFEAAVAVRPRFHEAHFNLGLVLASMGLPAEAIPRFRAVLALRPDDAAAEFNLAMMLDETGARDEASRRATHALDLARAQKDQEVVDEITAWLAERPP